MTPMKHILGWPFLDKKGRMRFPCSICGNAYRDQSDAGWCCFNKKESEDRKSQGPRQEEICKVQVHDGEDNTPCGWFLPCPRHIAKEGRKA